MQILVVEDDPDVRAALEMSLTDAGYGVATAADALRLAEAETPDMVLLDLMLPDRPGEDVYRALRANPCMCGTAVIIVSARSGEQDRVAGFELGADDYVAKPFSMRLLLLRIEAVLKRTRPARTKPHSPNERRTNESFQARCEDVRGVACASPATIGGLCCRR